MTWQRNELEGELQMGEWAHGAPRGEWSPMFDKGAQASIVTLGNQTGRPLQRLLQAAAAGGRLDRSQIFAAIRELSDGAGGGS